MEFDPNKKLTSHDVEVQLHTLKAIKLALDEGGEKILDMQTLQQMIDAGEEVLIAVQKKEKEDDNPGMGS